MCHHFPFLQKCICSGVCLKSVLVSDWALAVILFPVTACNPPPQLSLTLSDGSFLCYKVNQALFTCCAIYLSVSCWHGLRKGVLEQSPAFIMSSDSALFLKQLDCFISKLEKRCSGISVWSRISVTVCWKWEPCMCNTDIIVRCLRV